MIAEVQPEARGRVVSPCSFTTLRQISVCRRLRCITPKLNLAFNLSTMTETRPRRYDERETAFVMKRLGELIGAIQLAACRAARRAQVSTGGRALVVDVKNSVGRAVGDGAKESRRKSDMHLIQLKWIAYTLRNTKSIQIHVISLPLKKRKIALKIL